ncbi:MULTISPECIES: recombinase family protein [Tepidibacter]|jgi:DNA invertase Pin-like site-specific DNA recombinase|uniref:Site-specific DNA recombinase n=2 Tax=Tepidibacter TaxID=214904 RepID=A0A1M6TR57_9FIRM|nr:MULTISPECIES: recombinase family protein [Tepidibacter]WFD08696.1 recombinase family protein [Tepidibacter hydrothermalis]SHK59308.1 Site-specific DNA recombinase [Tepidibacter formicigenes DSM 15518]
MGKLFGYARVSTKDQNLDLQINTLKEAGCHPSDIYVEKISSRKKERPIFKKVSNLLQEGDTLVIWKLDRIGRSLVELVNIIEEINQKKANLKTLTGSLMIDTSTAQGKLMYSITAAFAEYERDINRERTLAGLEAARRRGVKFGPKFKLTDKDIKKMKQMKDVGMSIKDILSYFNIGKTTYYRYINSDKIDS